MPDDDLQNRLARIRRRQNESRTQQTAAQSSVPYISLKSFPIAQEAVALIPREDAEKYRIIAIYIDRDNVRAVTPQPDNQETKKFIAEFEKNERKKISLHMVSEDTFEETLNVYDRLPEVREIEVGIQIKEEDVIAFKDILDSHEKMQAKVDSLNMTELVTMIVASGIHSGASDMHVEAGEKEGVVRFRIDGELDEIIRVPKEVADKLTDRFKLVAKVKINIRDKPQDGRFTITLEGKKIEIRFSTLPTAFGESLVMRILRPSSISLSFDELGLMGKSYTRLKEQVERPNGMIVTTGPTGSGKTTTLYAILKKLNTEDTKIITLENPIEYKLEGIAQSGVDTKHGYSFADGLKSILRQDPDVVMVGEIRDLETADTAIQAALTGHIMLSTIHTNSAAGAIPRFLSMGVQPYLLPPALNAIIGQRLVRKLCKDCKKPKNLDPETLEKVKEIFRRMPKDHGYDINLKEVVFYAPSGDECATCHGVGYKGRIGIYEIFLMNKDIGAEIAKDTVSEYVMQEIAQKHGMVTMAQDGLMKAAMGITSVEQVFEVAEQKDVEEEVE